MSYSSRFADFPHWIPDRKITDPEELFTGWMLLSYRPISSRCSGSSLCSAAPLQIKRQSEANRLLCLAMGFGSGVSPDRPR